MSLQRQLPTCLHKVLLKRLLKLLLTLLQTQLPKRLLKPPPLKHQAPHLRLPEALNSAASPVLHSNIHR